MERRSRTKQGGGRRGDQEVEMRRRGNEENEGKAEKEMKRMWRRWRKRGEQRGGGNEVGEEKEKGRRGEKMIG